MKLRLAPVLALSALLTIPATASLAGQRSVEIVNKTGYAIVQFYGSNGGTDAWEEDILGEDLLAHGETVSVDFDDATGHCMFDFKAVFEDGDTLVRRGIDVCTLESFAYE